MGATMDRRTSLKAAALIPLGALALSRAGRLFAAPSAGGKLLIVFLRGGYDAANLLVPVSSPFYYESRPNIAVARPGSDANAAIALDARQGEIIREMYRGTRLESRVNEGLSVRDEVMRDTAGEMEMASRNAISTKGFELEARRIARLMVERYDVGFIDVGGWDTHVGEGGAAGYLATRLEELGRGLAGFSDALGAGWSATVGVVISEFGRTFRENGNRGTDHGHGTVYWVLGGSVRGGRG